MDSTSAIAANSAKIDTKPYETAREDKLNEALSGVKDKSLRDKLSKIKELLIEKQKLDRELVKEGMALKIKYEEKSQIYYDIRDNIINPKSNETKIEGFWLKCLQHHSSFAKLINKEDVEILKYLVNITVTNQSEQDFTLNFFFEKGIVLEQEILTKNYQFNKDNGIIERINATYPTFKKGEDNKDPRKTKIIIENGRGQGKNQKIEKEIPSFFRFFCSYNLKNLEDEYISKALAKTFPKKPTTNNLKSMCKNIETNKKVDIRTKVAEALKSLVVEDKIYKPMEILEEDLYLGNQIRNEIIPYAMDYYRDLVGCTDDLDYYKEVAALSDEEDFY